MTHKIFSRLLDEQFRRVSGPSAISASKLSLLAITLALRSGEQRALTWHHVNLPGASWLADENAG
jgi:hypothetical protein